MIHVIFILDFMVLGFTLVDWMLHFRFFLVSSRLGRCLGSSCSLVTTFSLATDVLGSSLLDNFGDTRSRSFVKGQAQLLPDLAETNL